MFEITTQYDGKIPKAQDTTMLPWQQEIFDILEKSNADCVKIKYYRDD